MSVARGHRHPGPSASTGGEGPVASVYSTVYAP
jgi:hypothetical protein